MPNLTPEEKEIMVEAEKLAFWNSTSDGAKGDLMLFLLQARREAIRKEVESLRAEIEKKIGLVLEGKNDPIEVYGNGRPVNEYLNKKDVLSLLSSHLSALGEDK